jgi:hypothetical protein
MPDALRTRHWVVAYADRDANLGSYSMWLDTPHGLIVTKALWDSAKVAVRAKTGDKRAIVLALTPFEDVSPQPAIQVYQARKGIFRWISRGIRS